MEIDIKNQERKQVVSNAAEKMSYGVQGEVPEVVEEVESEFESVIYPVYAMVPFISFIVNVVFGKIVNWFFVKQIEQDRIKHRRDEETEQGNIPGSNPITTDLFPHLVPTPLQRQLFKRYYAGNSAPLYLATFTTIKSEGTTEEILYEMKIGFQCLGYVGAITKLHTLFHLGSWSLFNLTEFPNGGDSVLKLDDLPASHYAFAHREKSTERILQLVVHSDFLAGESQQYQSM